MWRVTGREARVLGLSVGRSVTVFLISTLTTLLCTAVRLSMLGNGHQKVFQAKTIFSFSYDR